MSNEDTVSVTLRDFQPINRWKPELDGEKWQYGGLGAGEPKFIVDQTTNRRYFNESRSVVGFKCFLLTVGTPFVHTVASVVNVACRLFQLVTLAALWENKPDEKKYNLKARLADVGKNLLRIIATPISLAGLELAAAFGMFSPYDGRKLYATIERATYGSFVLAPCFQPNPERHLLGGDINKKDQL